MNLKQQKGFSLLEVLLAVTIAIALGSMQLGQIKRETESLQLKAVGEQLSMVGKALNSYVALQYHNITAGTNVVAPGSADDPGPRTCTSQIDPSNSQPIIMCTITSDTLRRSGLLPNNFSGRNAFGATYQYFIKVSGSSPNWRVEGLVATSDPYTVGTVPRFDLIGQAMVVAGADSGTTRSMANNIEGLNGSWSDPSYPVSQVGLLAYRVGYGTSGYSSYLRIDGANNMTGNLNIGNPADPATFGNIGAVRDITATGTVQGSKIVATSPTGDAITTTAGTIGANGSTMVVRTGALQVLQPTGTGRANIDAGNMNVGSVTASGGGVFGGAVEGTSLRSTSGGISSAADISANSNIIAGGNISTVNGNLITTNGNIAATNGNISSATLNVANSSFTTNSWVMGTGANAGGWYMDDTTWMKVQNNKGILTTGTIRGGTIESMGNTVVGGFIQLNGSQGLGTACTTIGSVSRDPNGRILQCVGSVWQSAASIVTTRVTSLTTCTNGDYCYAVCGPGKKLSGGGFRLYSRPTTEDPNSPDESFPDPMNNRWVVRSVTGFASSFHAEAVCAD